MGPDTGTLSCTYLFAMDISICICVQSFCLCVVLLYHCVFDKVAVYTSIMLQLITAYISIHRVCIQYNLAVCYTIPLYSFSTHTYIYIYTVLCPCY